MGYFGFVEIRPGTKLSFVCDTIEAAGSDEIIWEVEKDKKLHTTLGTHDDKCENTFSQEGNYVVKAHIKRSTKQFIKLKNETNSRIK